MHSCVRVNEYKLKCILYSLIVSVYATQAKKKYNLTRIHSLMYQIQFITFIMLTLNKYMEDIYETVRNLCATMAFYMHCIIVSSLFNIVV